jgi:hypothetical protein
MVHNLQEASAKYLDVFVNYTVLTECRNIQPICNVMHNKQDTYKKYAINMQPYAGNMY